MIIVWLMKAVSGLWHWLMTNLPAFTPPAWMATTVPNFTATVSGYASTLGSYFPFDQVSTALSLVVWSVLAAITIKLTRIFISFVTAGGGSAG